MTERFAKIYKLALECIRDHENDTATALLEICRSSGMHNKMAKMLLSVDLDKISTGDFAKLKALADHGYSFAQSSIGVCYSFGYGTPTSKEKAFHYYQVSANQGYSYALCCLGFCYENGVGVPTSNKKAFHCYKLSADQGYSYAQYSLGICYELGIGTPISNEKAFYYYQLSAAQGEEVAKRKLMQFTIKSN